MTRYIRFAVAGGRLWTGREYGLFQVAYQLRDSISTTPADRDLLAETLRWLDDHLDVPKRFNRSKSKGFYRRQSAGLSWFKNTAEHHVAKMRLLVAVGARYGFVIREITTDRPGYVVYEDEAQVVAEPFNDT